MSFTKDNINDNYATNKKGWEIIKKYIYYISLYEQSQHFFYKKSLFIRAGRHNLTMTPIQSWKI